MFVYVWERDTHTVRVGEAQREGDTESEAGSRLWAVSTEPDAGLEPTDHEIMTWAEIQSLSDGATQAPQPLFMSINLHLHHYLKKTYIVFQCIYKHKPLLLDIQLHILFALSKKAAINATVAKPPCTFLLLFLVLKPRIYACHKLYVYSFM